MWPLAWSSAPDQRWQPLAPQRARGWSEQDEPLFAAHFQPALLMDILNARGISSHQYLRGSGVFYDDVLAGEQRMSVQQWLQLLTSARALYDGDDLSFRWGHALWPGHYGEFSQLLQGCESLAHVIQVMADYRAVLAPLMSPLLWSDQRYCMISWQDNYGLGEQAAFVAEAYMTGLVGYCRWRSDSHWPWRIGFAHPSPSYREQYDVNLGDAIFFDVGANVLLIERDFLHQRWPSSLSPTALNVAQRHCLQQSQPALGFVAQAMLALRQRKATSLEQLAELFGLSPATCKRKLKKHHSSFQQLQDRVRLEQCQYRFHVCGWTNEQVAAHLGFSDVTNFRRAYKRWCGMTPSASKRRLLGFI
ncbi:AraC family transcriptional regulator [Bacterioplanes sanyensis]|uniref:AraC family transcriptional regulator n=1 Tax=Bacterioplanes sanyensis TaxID=1249553 RepID=A0A222FPI3_9GAMM|nr:AraC family transcriptional regulator [Bacterioplanes sanyensis]ASP40143.1 AraC family transcriptional regulator [Bacterioplanes sanyensis]